MTAFLRPSDGAIRQGAYLNLNRLGLSAGDRVLFEVEYGLPEIGTVDRVDGNRLVIDGGNIFMTNVKHRIRAGAGAAAETELLRRLIAFHAQLPFRYNQEREKIVRAWNAEQKKAA